MRLHLIVAGVALVIGLIVGGISHLVARVIYLELVAPIFIGAAVGMALSAAIRRVCYPRPKAAIGLAALSVVVVLVTHTVADYAHERARESGQRDDFERRFQWALLEPDDLTFSYFIAERYGFMQTGPDHRWGSGLGPPGIIAVTVLELFIGILIAGIWVRAQAREPACPACNTWRARYALGRTAIGVTREFLARLSVRDVAGAAELLEPPDTPEYMHLSVMACRNGHDDGGGVLRVMERRRDRRQRWRRRHIADVPITRRALASVASAVSVDALTDASQVPDDPKPRDHRADQEHT